MILLDANILLYAYNPSLEQHPAARRWLEQSLSTPQPVLLAWVTVLAFMRIATNPRAFEEALSVQEAASAASSWLERPMVKVIHPGEHHLRILGDLLEATGARGPEVMDAHLAALALEHGAILCTTDRGFARFPGLRFVNPLA